jgi:hypothetical protein
MKYNNLHFSNRKFEGAALNLEGPEKKGTLRLARKTTTDLIFRGKSIISFQIREGFAKFYRGEERDDKNRYRTLCPRRTRQFAR